MWRTPRCASASITALCAAGVAPMVPASPIPLTPNGLRWVGRGHVEQREAGQLRRGRDAVVGERGGERGCRPRRRRPPPATPARCPARCRRAAAPRRCSGLRTGPASSMVTILSMTALPDSTSTSATATCAPNGNVGAPESNRVSTRSFSRSARSASETAVSVPRTTTAPSLHHEVVDVRLQQVGRPLLGHLHQLARRLVDGHAAGLQAARAHRARAARDEVGVAVLDGDLLDRDVEVLAREHRPGRRVPLPVRGGAGEHGDRAVGVHLDRGALLERPAAGDLDEHRRRRCRSAPRRRARAGRPARRAGRRSPTASSTASSAFSYSPES